MARFAALALALALAFAGLGCLAATDSSVKLAPFTGIVRAEPGRATEIAAFLNNTGAFRADLDLAVEGLPEGWTFTAWPNGSLVVDGRETAFAIWSLAPPAGAPHGPQPLTLVAGSARADVVVDVRDLGRTHARAGVGVQVRTVGFYENGTVFYSNMKEVRDDPAIAWHVLSEDAKSDAAMEPLKVYVGGKRRTPPPEPYNSTGYSPVIEGFDERLRTGNGGMRAGETLAVRIPSGKAYTLPGNEDHVLYGFNLSFVIEVVSVDNLPARSGVVCVPSTPVCVPPPREV